MCQHKEPAAAAEAAVVSTAARGVHSSKSLGTADCCMGVAASDGAAVAAVVGAAASMGHGYS